MKVAVRYNLNPLAVIS